MPDARKVLEHAFRHQYGRLVSVLTKSLGVRNLQLAEDVVQVAMSKALQVWAKDGIPDDIGAWLYRTSRNLAIDHLRRQKTEQRLLDSGRIADNSGPTDSNLVLFDSEVGDEPLRMIFLCCNPSIPSDSRLAFTLKTVAGFSIQEVAAALLISTSNAEKRVFRAREKLRELALEIGQLTSGDMLARIDSVRATIYLMFNEGYASSSGATEIRKELCDEAIRLTRMLIEFVDIQRSVNCALLALMLLHSARFDARSDAAGTTVLLEDQVRSHWNGAMIQEALFWMSQSTQEDQLSRYHLEAAIAWEHCRANSLTCVDWTRIVEYYEILAKIDNSPMVQLNHAIANSYVAGPMSALHLLVAISPQERARLRPWWDCAVAEMHQRLDNHTAAMAHLQDALALCHHVSQREVIERKLSRCREITLSRQEN
jgi:RNA polymerase sigma factor (sigma-70 family)